MLLTIHSYLLMLMNQLECQVLKLECFGFFKFLLLSYSIVCACECSCGGLQYIRSIQHGSYMLMPVSWVQSGLVTWLLSRYNIDQMYLSSEYRTQLISKNSFIIFCHSIVCQLYVCVYMFLSQAFPSDPCYLSHCRLTAEHEPSDQEAQQCSHSSTFTSYSRKMSLIFI